MVVVTMHEINGEQEYNHYIILKDCKTIKEAEKKADKIAKHWYAYDKGEKPDKDDNGYYHLGGNIFVEVESINNISPDEFIKKFEM